MSSWPGCLSTSITHFLLFVPSLWASGTGSVGFRLLVSLAHLFIFSCLLKFILSIAILSLGFQKVG